MDKSEILSHVDHTVLSTTAVTGDMIAACDAAIKFRTASVCIPPCFVRTASEYASGRTKICTVIGFPNGYNTSEIKCAEAQSAISDGADEIDMVINIGALKEKRFDFVLGEIKQLRSVCEGKILKVIIETSL
ncbi:MAG: deoxyribose-phosphate aldolase, partial [Eubacteriales bacterium]